MDLKKLSRITDSEEVNKERIYEGEETAIEMGVPAEVAEKLRISFFEALIVVANEYFAEDEATSEGLEDPEDRAMSYTEIYSESQDYILVSDEFLTPDELEEIQGIYDYGAKEEFEVDGKKKYVYVWNATV